MGSVKTAWPTSQLTVMDEIVILVVYGLGKSVVSKNVQTRKSVLKLGLQRVIPIVSVVAEIINTLSPSEAREERLAEILRTWSGYRLIRIVRGTITGKDVSSLVSHITHVERSIV